jgi:hypothetical protein
MPPCADERKSPGYLNSPVRPSKEWLFAEFELDAVLLFFVLYSGLDFLVLIFFFRTQFAGSISP